MRAIMLNANKTIHLFIKGASFMAKKLYEKYKHGWVFLYAFIYLPWFFYLEKHVTTDFTIIHVALDDKIPFIEFFIVPYMLWFLFIAVTIGYFFFTSKTEFYQLITFLFSGMTIFLIISTLFPNGLNLRPDTFVRDNIFVDMVKALYITDTPTNVLPSIHVYNTIGAYIAIYKSETLQKHKSVQTGSFILAVSIILSTMFLKQHSVVDVVIAFGMSGIFYVLSYGVERSRSHNLIENLAKIN